MVNKETHLQLIVDAALKLVQSLRLRTLTPDIMHHRRSTITSLLVFAKYATTSAYNPHMKTDLAYDRSSWRRADYLDAFKPSSLQGLTIPRTVLLPSILLTVAYSMIRDR